MKDKEKDQQSGHIYKGGELQKSGERTGTGEAGKTPEELNKTSDVKKSANFKKSNVYDNCPHCGKELSPWEKVLLSVDRMLMCKNCWYRIVLDVLNNEDKK